MSHLLLEHMPLLQAFIRLRMGSELRSRESCSDLAQSVCLDLLRQQNFEYRGVERFRAWLCRAALNKIRQRQRHYRARRRDAGQESPGLSPEEIARLAASYASVCTPSRDAAGKEELQRVESALDELPEDYREVIVLSRLAGLPHSEIGRIMGRSSGAVRMLLHRALVRLATVLAG